MAKTGELDSARESEEPRRSSPPRGDPAELSTECGESAKGSPTSTISSPSPDCCWCCCIRLMGLCVPLRAANIDGPVAPPLGRVPLAVGGLGGCHRA